jgi:protein gp37
MKLKRGTTGIGWTDDTGNIIRGCSRTCADGAEQSGCGDKSGGGCYAEEMAGRIVLMDRARRKRGKLVGPGKYDGLVRETPTGWRWTGVVRMDDGDLRKLLRPRGRTHRRRFVNSMSDPFHANFPDSELDKFWAGMLINARHELGGNTTFQVLTKRPERARAYLSDPRTLERVARAAGHMMEDGDGWLDAILFGRGGLTDPLIWLGTSAEHQRAAAERIPHLMATPAAVRFVSVEPLLGPVHLRHLDADAAGHREWNQVDALTGRQTDMGRPCPDVGGRLDWVIAGCESGHRARPAELDWFRRLRDDCKATAVPFFLKQVGEGGRVVAEPELDGEQHLEFPPIPALPPLAA